MGIGGLTCSSGADPSPAHLSGSEQPAFCMCFGSGWHVAGEKAFLIEAVLKRTLLQEGLQPSTPGVASCYKTKRTLRKSGASVKFCNSRIRRVSLCFCAGARWYGSTERKGIQALHSLLCRSFRMTGCCAAILRHALSDASDLHSSLGRTPCISMAEEALSGSFDLPSVAPLPRAALNMTEGEGVVGRAGSRALIRTSGAEAQVNLKPLPQT
jgi:hypothetical protein